MPHALLVDDDVASLGVLERLVQAEGFTTSTACRLDEARELVSRQAADIALVDLCLPDGSGLDLLDGVALAAPTPMVLITGNADTRTTIEALRRGVLDVLVKPVDMDRLRWHLSRVADADSLDALRRQFREQHGDEGFGSMIGRSAKMRHLYHLIARVAPSDAPVLVGGESGTGKELVARTLHDLSPRSEGPFVSLNCGALPQHLVESELFGHEKGSFTGADRTHRGVFEQAAGGTLFLDEIAEMPLDLQVRLLRVLESGAFRRVGGERDFRTDVRIVAASNRSLLDAIEDRDFREDLFYRLEVFPIDVPPLRERADDIVLLAEHFLAELNRPGKTPKRFTPALLQRLRTLPWPGNVRQLKNAVQRLYLLADEEIGTDLLPDPRAERQATTGLTMSVGMSIAEAERRLIEATLERMDGNKTASAEVLGISLKTLYNRVKAYRLADRTGEA